MAKIGVRTFANVIRERRRHLDLTQEEVARRIDTSVPYVGLLEAGRRHPSAKVVTKLADVLGLANPTAKNLVSPPVDSNTPSAWAAFSEDENMRRIHSITDREMETLSQVALMGDVRSSRDFVFILNTIRQALGK